MLENGPDMDVIEELIEDESVKGMFCVPKYSNPQGITYSDEVVERIAALNPAAEDFRIIWDNAYCVHELTDNGDKLLNIFDVLPKYNNEDMVIEVCSTSKITFPGAGVSAIIASDNNIAAIKKRLNVETISYDKMNQQRHVAFFKNADGILSHMKKKGISKSELAKQIGWSVSKTSKIFSTEPDSQKINISDLIAIGIALECNPMLFMLGNDEFYTRAHSNSIHDIF